MDCLDAVILCFWAFRQGLNPTVTEDLKLQVAILVTQDLRLQVAILVTQDLGLQVATLVTQDLGLQVAVLVIQGTKNQATTTCNA